MALTADGRFAVSASFDKTLKMWDLTSGLAVAMLETPAPISCCAVASERLLLAGDATGVLHSSSTGSPQAAQPPPLPPPAHRPPPSSPTPTHTPKPNRSPP